MTTAARPNFFILLGLNPDADWNQAAFEQTLRQKRVEWSRQGAGVAKKALAARQNLAFVPAITEVMASPELREKEAQAARKELASARKAHIERFEKQLAEKRKFLEATQAKLDNPPSQQQYVMSKFQELGVPAQPIQIDEKITWESHFFEPKGFFTAHLIYSEQSATLQIAVSQPVSKWQLDNINITWTRPP